MEANQMHGAESLHAFDWTESESPSSAVVRAVSAVSGTDPTDLEPLYDAIDPDSLDGLFSSARSPRSAGRVTFAYHGYRVVVTADGCGYVRERDGSSLESSPGSAEEYR